MRAMMRLYAQNLALIVFGAVLLGGLWFCLDRVLTQGEYLWTYLAMPLGVGVVVLAGVLGAHYQRFERRLHEAHR